MTMPMMIMNAERKRRSMRRPKFPIFLKSQPYHIHPFFIHPVFAGETLEQIRFQFRTVTDPILNPLAGWWNGYWFFYVKGRDLYERDEFSQLLVNPAASSTPFITAAGSSAINRFLYYSGGVGQINWMLLCLRRIVDCYWRDEGDTYAQYVATDSSLPLAQYHGNDFTDSIATVDQLTAVDVDVEGSDANTTIQASEVAEAMARWQALQDENLLEMNFEDYLRHCGIRQPDVELHKPELLRFVEEWQYPSNTIDPTNGTPRSAVSWSMKGSADKKRFFKEPGFIVGIACCRPKSYKTTISGSVVSNMNSMRNWLPPWLQTSRHSSYITWPQNQGPITGITDDNGYAIDLKDLLRYGEQFILRASGDTTPLNALACPNGSLSIKRYPTAVAEWSDNCFVDQTNTTCYVRHDGVVDLPILTKVAPTDTSQRGGPVEET